jgi:hypothetical protein
VRSSIQDKRRWAETKQRAGQCIPSHLYQLLFAANKAHRDIQTAVLFLTTRVQEPDEDDLGKQKRILKYLNGSRHLKLTLCAKQLKFTVHSYQQVSSN